MTIIFVSVASAAETDGVIKLGAFNLQVFGPKKASDPEVMNVLSKIIRNYDVIAVEEIRDEQQTALPALKNTVNLIGSPQYDYVVSERLGRTTSKEQYAYFFNTQTIGLIGNPYTFNDSEDLFEREPFVANFKVKNGNFNFVSITIHTKPENATQEINDLPLVVDDAKMRYQGEDDFIIMGDLNADCDYFDENSQSPLRTSDYYWVINNSVDTTTKSTVCTYDRIIITTPAISDFSGDSGVFKFDTAYNLDYNRTINVSDHYPVYANFLSDREIPTPTPTPNPTPNPTPTPTPTTKYTPSITGLPQEDNVSDSAGATRTFNITVNQTVSVTWYINDTPAQSNVSVTESMYTNTSAVAGIWNITATANNDNGTASQTWFWTVKAIPLFITIISPGNNSVNDTGYVNVNVTLNKTGIAQYMNWNGVNYTMTPDTSQPAGTVFFRKMTGLLSGNYILRVYANDTTGLSNVSETRVLSVNRTIVDTTIGSFINTTNFIVNKTIEITSPGGNVTVTIPNGTNASVGGAALTSISIDSLAQVNSTYMANLGSGNILIGENLSLGPEGAQFSPDIQIRFNYTDAQLTAAGITASSLRVKFYNPTTNTWVEQTPYTLNTTGKYITANVSHFSTFVLFGTITPTTTPNPPSSGSSSGGGGGGGGGGGTSGENYSNIEIKEKYEDAIYKDKPTSYRFKMANNPVTFVNITGNVNAGLINIAAEVLKGRSTLVKDNAPGIVYKNINIWVGTSGFATSKNIKEANVIFRVENSWIDGNTFPRNEIKLVKWDNGKWITLETSEKMKDTTYTYFEGKTTSFSSFAITGIKVASSAPAFEVTPTQSTPAALATTTTTTTTEKAPAANLFMIIAAIAIIAIIVVLYLKYK